MPCEVGLLCDTIMMPRGLKALRKMRRGIGPCEAWYLHTRRPNKRIRRGGWNNPQTRGPHFGGRGTTSKVGVLCHAIMTPRGLKALCKNRWSVWPCETWHLHTRHKGLGTIEVCPSSIRTPIVQQNHGVVLQTPRQQCNPRNIHPEAKHW